MGSASGSGWLGRCCWSTRKLEPVFWKAKKKWSIFFKLMKNLGLCFYKKKNPWLVETQRTPFVQQTDNSWRLPASALLLRGLFHQIHMNQRKGNMHGKSLLLNPFALLLSMPAFVSEYFVSIFQEILSWRLIRIVYIFPSIWIFCEIAIWNWLRHPTWISIAYVTNCHQATGAHLQPQVTPLQNTRGAVPAELGKRFRGESRLLARAARFS